MLDFNASEFLVVGIVALLVIGPKDLPKAMRFVGQWVAKARVVARQFRSGFDTMLREAELADMEKKWAEENARIMQQYPASDPLGITDQGGKSAKQGVGPDGGATASNEAPSAADAATTGSEAPSATGTEAIPTPVAGEGAVPGTTDTSVADPAPASAAKPAS